MSSRMGIFAPPKYPVLSLGVQAQSAINPRPQGQFEVLVRHLLHRFFHNELLASDDETKRVMLIAYTIALPTLFVALVLFPAYHAFPPYPLIRPFWAQVGDHYFYVMYSFIAMGAATVYEWDLLFPDLLDVFVLSILPITARRLFFARVLALTIFLALVLVGTSILGMIFLPLIAGLPNIGHHFLGHTEAVLMSGVFATSTFLALQGILINIVGERIFRRIGPLIQGASVMLLLAVLFLDPMLSRSIEPLLTSNSPAVRWFPPFWYLGIYERLLGGSSVPAIFSDLAHTGIYALVLTLACALLTYPLAYRRRVRQIIEGASAINITGTTTAGLNRLLHATMVRLPGQRAVFHFISQTVLRSHRHRVMLAMYGGLGIALTLANMIVLQFVSGHIGISLSAAGTRAAVPIMTFWTVAGLSSVLHAPVDRRGVWLFRVLHGRPRDSHLEGSRLWITLWAAVSSIATALLLLTFSPASLHTPGAVTGQFLVAIGGSFLLTDIFLFPVRTLPFTSVHKSAITDFPFMILRYVVLFPLSVIIVVRYEPAIEFSLVHLLGTLLLVIGAHLLLLHAHSRSLQQTTVDTSLEEGEDFPQSLGLRDTGTS